MADTIIHDRTCSVDRLLVLPRQILLKILGNCRLGDVNQFSQCSRSAYIFVLANSSLLAYYFECASTIAVSRSEIRVSHQCATIFGKTQRMNDVTMTIDPRKRWENMQYRIFTRQQIFSLRSYSVDALQSAFRFCRPASLTLYVNADPHHDGGGMLDNIILSDLTLLSKNTWKSIENISLRFLMIDDRTTENLRRFFDSCLPIEKRGNRRILRCLELHSCRYAYLKSQDNLLETLDVVHRVEKMTETGEGYGNSGCQRDCLQQLSPQSICRIIEDINSTKLAHLSTLAEIGAADGIAIVTKMLAVPADSRGFRARFCMDGFQLDSLIAQLKLHPFHAAQQSFVLNGVKMDRLTIAAPMGGDTGRQIFVFRRPLFVVDDRCSEVQDASTSSPSYRPITDRETIAFLDCANQRSAIEHEDEKSSEQLQLEDTLAMVIKICLQQCKKSMRDRWPLYYGSDSPQNRPLATLVAQRDLALVLADAMELLAMHNACVKFQRIGIIQHHRVLHLQDLLLDLVHEMKYGFEL